MRSRVVTTLAEEVLEEIFLRLGDAPADLTRASAACTTFRRTITSRALHHRIRASFHRRPFLFGLLKLQSQGQASSCEFLPPSRPTAPHLPPVASRGKPTSPSPSSPNPSPPAAAGSSATSATASPSYQPAFSPGPAPASWSATPFSAVDT